MTAVAFSDILGHGLGFGVCDLEGRKFRGLSPAVLYPFGSVIWVGHISTVGIWTWNVSLLVATLACLRYHAARCCGI